MNHHVRGLLDNGDLLAEAERQATCSRPATREAAPFQADPIVDAQRQAARLAGAKPASLQDMFFAQVPSVYAAPPVWVNPKGTVYHLEGCPRIRCGAVSRARTEVSGTHRACRRCQPNEASQ
jgi:hypothetical protein